MTTRPHITAFVKKDCVYCEQAKSTLRDAGMAFITKYDTDDNPRNTDASVYLSGKDTVPQIFVGDYPIGGADDVAALWQTRRLRDIVATVDPHTKLGFTDLTDEELARDAKDMKVGQYLPISDGTHTDDPEQWPILHFYKEFFGFWPNTFLYLHHWPEAYKRFLYCYNMPIIRTARGILDMPLLTSITYTTSNTHGCNYCQVHSVAGFGDMSLGANEQLRLARIGQRDEGNPFDEYWVSLTDLAGMASLNTVPKHYLDRLQLLAKDSEHAPVNVHEQIMATALISSSMGFFNVFNDLTGLDIEGGWAAAAKERLDFDFGRHEVNEDRNPHNLSHELPHGGPSLEQMIGKYVAEVGDITSYTTKQLGLVPSWMNSYPSQIQPLQAALYTEIMEQREGSSITPEFKHLLAYVSHVEKGHVALAHTEAFIAHHVTADRPHTLQRLQHSFAVASSRGGDETLFSDVERAALRLAYLSAQTPLITPRRFVQPMLKRYDAPTCVEVFVVCSVASMVQRFAAIMTPAPDPIVEAFVAEHDLSTGLQALRFPLL